MTSTQKTALSVLIAVFLFGFLTVIAFTGLFSVIDSRFYEPSKISKISKKLDSISASYDEYIQTLDARFATGESAFLKNQCVASFVESRPSAADAKARTELTGALRSSTQGLSGIRVVDKNFVSMHYSTFRDDILRENLEENLVAYRNYNEATTDFGNNEIAMSEIAAEDTGGNIKKGARVFYDGKNGRIIFSYPFYDKFMVFRGTIIFYVNASDFERLLVKQNLVGVGAPFNFIADEDAHGFALGIPSVAYDEFVAPILAAWKENKTSAQKLFAINDTSKHKNYWIMVTSLAGEGCFVSEVFNDEILVLPLSARVLILLCIFATIFLIVFLVLNLRRDDMTVIRERILTLQLGVVDEYLKRKADFNLKAISGKRAAVTKEILESLGKRGKLHRQEVEELIERSWDELLTAMNLAPKQAQNATFSAESTEEIKNMLQEILSSGNIKVQAVGGVSSGLTSVSPSSDSTVYASSADDVEDLEEVESLEEVEELGDAEEVEEVEELEDVDVVEEATQVIEETSVDEPIEELAEVEPVEPAKDLGTATQELKDAFDNILENDDDLAASVAVEQIEPIEEISFEDMGDEFFGPSKPKPVHSPEEMFDITELPSDDFFAVKTEEKKKRTSGLLSLAEMKNNEGFNALEEDEAVLNFKTGLPLFEMDEDSSEEDNYGDDTYNDDDDGFGGFDDDDDDDFGGGDTGSDTTSSDDDIDFVIETPPKARGSLLAKAMMIASGSNDKTVVSNSEPVLEPNVSSSVPLSNMESYMFGDMQPQDNDVIKQDSNGVFSIQEEIETDGVEQDNSFKRLVDSVLNH